MFAGGALSIWIIAEVAMMRELHWLHLAYGVLGAAIFGLGLRACLRSPSPRHRWIALVTLAETVGFMAPTSAGILEADTELIVAAGFIEGLVLGAGQAWAFPLPLNRWRFAALTSIGAGIAWAGVMSAILFGGALAVVAGVVALLAIGTAQWLELRRHANRAHRWILWTALAWIVALPLSFAPGPFVDEATPLASRLALFGAGGALMAYVMALITWQAVRRLTPARPPAAR